MTVGKLNLSRRLQIFAAGGCLILPSILTGCTQRDTSNKAPFFDEWSKSTRNQRESDTQNFVRACMKKQGFSYTLPLEKQSVRESHFQSQFDPLFILQNLDSLVPDRETIDVSAVRGLRKLQKAPNGQIFLTPEELEINRALLGTGNPNDLGCLYQAEAKFGPYTFESAVEKFDDRYGDTFKRLASDPGFDRIDTVFRSCARANGIQLNSLLRFYPERRDQILDLVLSGSFESEESTVAAAIRLDEEIVKVYKKCSGPLAVQAIPLIKAATDGH
jgi:hypothetical protein